MVIVSFVRHAETVSNRKHTIQGQQDGKLTHFGRKQAKRIAKRLENDYIPFIYSSDLKRCRQTAKKIAKYHPDAPVVRDPRLRERAVGVLEGRPSGSTKESAAEHGTTDRSFRPEGGESLQDVKKRAKQFWKELVTMVIPKLFNLNWAFDDSRSRLLCDPRAFFLANRQPGPFGEFRSKFQDLTDQISEVLPHRCNSENDAIDQNTFKSSFSSLRQTTSSSPLPIKTSASSPIKPLRSLSLPPSLSPPSSPSNQLDSSPTTQILNSSLSAPLSSILVPISEHTSPHVVIVTHSGFIKEVLNYLVKICDSPTGFFKIPGAIYHTAIFSFRIVSPDKVQPLFLSDVQHLKGLGQAYAEKFGFKKKK